MQRSDLLLASQAMEAHGLCRADKLQMIPLQVGHAHQERRAVAELHCCAAGVDLTWQDVPGIIGQAYSDGLELPIAATTTWFAVRPTLDRAVLSEHAPRHAPRQRGKVGGMTTSLGSCLPLPCLWLLRRAHWWLLPRP